MGLLHYGLGEALLFRHSDGFSKLPPLGFPPVAGGPQAAWLTIRAVWHVLTVFGWTFAFILAHLGAQGAAADGERLVVRAIAAATAASAAVMFLFTRGKHVAWMLFLAAAALGRAGGGVS